MNLRSLFAVAAVAAAALPAHAVSIVGWDFENATSGDTTVASDVGSGSGLLSVSHAANSTYAVFAGNGSAKGFSSTGWTTNDYDQFAFGTLGFTGVSISFDQIGSNTGPAKFAVQYSTDGISFTTLAGSAYTVVNPTPAWSATVASATTSYAFAVTGIDNVSSAYIRLVDTSTTSVNGGTVASGGTSRLDNFLVSGTAVAAVPEPETYAMLLAGLGVVGFVAGRRRA